MNYLDLFSGIGGFALGAYWADWRFDAHYFSEVDPWAVELYQKRFPDAIPLGDITKIDTKELSDGEWIITAGFPCPDISIAGKGEGIHGTRSGLWFEAWRIIRDLRPCFAIMENVGALTFRGLTDVLGSLAEIGFDAEWQGIRASDLGYPTLRERLWIIAYSHERGLEVFGNGDCSGKIQGRRDASDAHHIANAIERFWTTASRTARRGERIPHRVDRLRGLGNAIVPQIAELIFRQLEVA